MISSETLRSAVYLLVTASVACSPAAASGTDAGDHHADGGTDIDTGTGRPGPGADTGTGGEGGGGGSSEAGAAGDSEVHPEASAPHKNCPAANFSLGVASSLSCGANPRGFGVADMDGDGFDDIVVGNSFDMVPPDNSPDIGVFINKGDGTFKAQAAYPYDPGGADLETYQLILGDFDGQNGPDVIVCDNVCAFQPNNGDGSLGAAVIIASANTVLSPASPVVADFDGNGTLDFAVLQTDSPSEAVVFLNGGNASFAGGTPLALPDGASFLAVGNIDGQHPSLVTFSNTLTVGVLLNSGHGAFGSQISTLPLATNPQDDYPTLAVADIDGDGKADVIANDAANVFVLIGKGDGTFKAAKIYQTTFTSGNGIVLAADLNGDGFADIAVADGDPGGTGSVNIFYNDKTGAFGTPVTSELGTSSLGGPDALVGGNFLSNGLLGLATPINLGQNSTPATIAVLLPACSN